jgi:putative addiction module killer protein
MPTGVHTLPVYGLIKSSTFDAWLRDLRDIQARARIEVRVRRLGMGNPGQYRALTDGIFELKVDHGPGYRVYYTMRNKLLVLLLCGGDKRTQQADIRQALRIAKAWDEKA